MNKFCFTIREMKIQSNFYIKDLNIYGDIKQYWQYTIGNIDYFIPNFGHLVMFDHNYNELVDPVNKGKYRIMMKDEFGDVEDEIKSVIISNAIECLSAKSFGSIFTIDGGVGLSENIGNLLNEIEKELIDLREDVKNRKIKQDEFWGHIICKFMIKLDYIHNRVGTPVRDIEYNYIRKNDSRPRPFKVGELVIYEEKFETYKILLFIKNINESTCECIGKKLNTDLYEIISNVPRDLLYHYSELDTIKQDGKLGEPIIGYEHILERYIL